MSVWLLKTPWNLRGRVCSPWLVKKGVDMALLGAARPAAIFDGAHPLARGKQGKSEFVVMWTNLYQGKTRVFSTTIGHNDQTVEDPRYPGPCDAGCSLGLRKARRGWKTAGRLREVSQNVTRFHCSREEYSSFGWKEDRLPATLPA